MRTNIKADGIEVSKEMRARLDWICAKLLETADAKPGASGALRCDFVVSKTGVSGGSEFRAEITFFDAYGHAHSAVALADSPIAALDIAHDEIEQAFSREQRLHNEKQKVTDINRRHADAAKKYNDEPPRRSPGVRRRDDD